MMLKFKHLSKLKMNCLTKIFFGKTLCCSKVTYIERNKVHTVPAPASLYQWRENNNLDNYLSEIVFVSTCITELSIIKINRNYLFFIKRLAVDGTGSYEDKC